MLNNIIERIPLFLSIGDYGNSAYENKDYLILVANRSNTDEKLKKEIIDFLTVKFIEQMNEVIKKMNELIK